MPLQKMTETNEDIAAHIRRVSEARDAIKAANDAIARVKADGARVLQLRDALEVSVFDAKRLALREALLAAIMGAKTLEELQPAMATLAILATSHISNEH